MCDQCSLFLVSSTVFFSHGKIDSYMCYYDACHVIGSWWSKLMHTAEVQNSRVNLKQTIPRKTIIRQTYLFLRTPQCENNCTP